MWKSVPSEVTAHQVVSRTERFISYLRGLASLSATPGDTFFLLLVDVFVVPSRREQMHRPKPHTSWAVSSWSLVFDGSHAFFTSIKDYFYVEGVLFVRKSTDLKLFERTPSQNDWEQRDGERVPASLYSSTVAEYYVHHARVKGKRPKCQTCHYWRARANNEFKCFISITPFPP